MLVLNINKIISTVIHNLCMYFIVFNHSCLSCAYLAFVLGFDSLMASYRLHDLALLFQLFSRVKTGQEELCTAFNEYIKVRVV